eukprot:COSAG01_NODE_27062_length_695_cov_2.456376_1_plen_85_part_00
MQHADRAPSEARGSSKKKRQDGVIQIIVTVDCGSEATTLCDGLSMNLKPSHKGGPPQTVVRGGTHLNRRGCKMNKKPSYVYGRV